VKGAHRWLGFIHAMYMAGCLVAPFIATGVASSGNHKWHFFYAAPIGLGVLNLALVWVAFREWATFKKASPTDEQATVSRQKDARVEMQKTLSSGSVWLISLFFFFFLGAVITAGGMSPLQTSSLTRI
jgi:MFS family permease